MIPAAAYPAVVVPVETENGAFSIQWGPATPKSPFTAAVCFEILSGPQAGQKITAFLYFGEGSVGHSMKALRACGFTGDDIDKFADQTPDIECQIVVEHEVYEGKTRAKVKWINQAGGQGFTFEKPLDRGSLRKFSAQFKSALKAVPSVTGKKAERQAPSAAPPSDYDGMDSLPPPTDNPPDGPPPASDDDIPF